MTLAILNKWIGAAALAVLSAGPALATTQVVNYDTVNGVATVPAPFSGGDNLFVNLFTTEHGPLTQATTFTVAQAVDVEGLAVWISNQESTVGPRLEHVDIFILNSADVMVETDVFIGSLGAFGHSSLDTTLGPGTYRLMVTGNAERDASLDISLAFTSAVPEPATYGMLLGGLGLLGVAGWRRRR